MQGKLFIGVLMMSAMAPAAAMAAEPGKRQTCQKTEQPQQHRQQQVQQQPQRTKPQGCPVQRAIPPVVDPTPSFLL